MEAHRILRRRGSYIFYIIDSQMAARLSALPSFTARKFPSTYFCYRLSRPQDHSASGRIRSFEKSNYLIGLLQNKETRTMKPLEQIP
jgi:hypothetical protein